LVRPEVSTTYPVPPFRPFDPASMVGLLGISVRLRA
jgi:hypothetical protein